MTVPPTRLRAARSACRGLAVCAVALSVLLRSASAASAQEPGRQELARELAGLMLDDASRKGLDRQVGAAMLQVIGAMLQNRLSRPLLESEWRTISAIVARFVAATLTPARTDEIAARVYARHFDEAELRELLRFQRSEVGRKAARLTPAIGTETAQAIDVEIKESASMPALLAELEREFPVLKFQESP